MKSVLISIKPKWCELIANGQKTVEVRKTRPKLETPFKCYIYCTNVKSMNLDEYVKIHRATSGRIDDWSGKVIGEFLCDHIMRHCEMANADIAEQQSRVKREKILEYANGNEVYGWHISDLVIYDEPEMLHHFFKPCGDCDKKGTKRCTEELTDCRAKVITRPPQSWCYVEERKMRE